MVQAQVTLEQPELLIVLESLSFLLTTVHDDAAYEKEIQDLRTKIKSTFK